MPVHQQEDTMLTFLCLIGLAVCSVSAAQPANVPIERYHAPPPLTRPAIVVTRHQSSPHVDVCYPRAVPTLFAPCLNDNAGDGGGGNSAGSDGASSGGSAE
jgi:hypothetical protein